MSQPQTPLPFALTAYGLPHTMGYLPTRDGERHPEPLDVYGLMDLAVSLGLGAIEIPLDKPGTPTIGALRDALQERNLRIVPDAMNVSDFPAEGFARFLQDAHALGADVVRTTLSSILCGDRRQFAGGWPAQLEKVVAALKVVLPIAEQMGMAIAVENHQDATSDDLLYLYEATGESPAFGVCLDAGNPLAVGEGPVEFAQRIGHLVRHIHLKDYTLHLAPNGYRLVRCAAGEGVVNFESIMGIVRQNGHALIPGIEIAAQPARTIPLLESSWWEHYPETQARHLPEALRVVWDKGQPQTAPYGSAWEQGKDSKTVSREELEIVTRSARYFRGLMGLS